MKKQEVIEACKFSDKTVLSTFSKDEIWDIYKSVKDTLGQEIADNLFSERDIVVKPLNHSEIEQLAFNIMKLGITNESMFDKTDQEILTIARENTEGLSEYLKDNKLVNRLPLDRESKTTEKVWSSSELYKIVKSNVPFQLP